MYINFSSRWVCHNLVSCMDDICGQWSGLRWIHNREGTKIFEGEDLAHYYWESNNIVICKNYWLISQCEIWKIRRGIVSEESFRKEINQKRDVSTGRYSVDENFEVTSCLGSVEWILFDFLEYIISLLLYSTLHEG